MSVLELLRESPVLFYCVVAFLGLVVGSFLNVVIHRLPIMMERSWRAELEEARAAETGERATEPSARLALAGGPEAEAGSGTDAPYHLVAPRSRCPHCEAPITAWQNVPLVSWLLLRGRCAHCRAPISVRYPLVEATTMLLSLVVAWQLGPTPEAALGILVTWFLVALTMIDVDHQLLPDDLTLPLMWIGLLAALVPVFADLPSAVIGAAAGYLILWSVFHLFRLATGKEGMGYGDFKLLAALGALLGWQALPTVILLSSLVGAVVGVTIIVVTRRSKDIPIPFGPYLAAAGWITMLWGEDIGRWYLG